MTNAKLAVVTGASSGIGKELARLCAKDGYNLVIAADEPAVQQAAEALASHNVMVEAIEADLASVEGVDQLITRIGDRDIDLLFLNAGRGLGDGFIDQDWQKVRRVIDTNITGTVYLAHELGARMARRGRGRILFTGSIAGFMPGTFQAVYNGTKAFIDSFSIALRHEMRDTGVTVTVLMPGATQTRFFERAEMMDTKVGTDEKDNPADVARTGYDAMMAGEEQVISGWKNKLQVAAAHVTPAGTLAEQHRKMAEPGSASRD
ncbi:MULTISPECIES: SDR family NAD(P)-dependent oxidoreductase [unclassified Mesorhizobium]|uniref:SDR family NAD(P)-dependent oxidoreductase n=1 Tax=unclassified Mesorhizobium TaxID=325217 RepID=UPI001CC9C26B|nr:MULTISPECIES: SDR family NAD(P)-dependent oxidoreductase [unclassified Mesorhizobium]MBZ9740825.1 SDR family NAD(P)-dependent oxidoreductase [Mesorhizobium sp. CO1-1-4]MBZ9804078.1 SDR family NAD(P)-dependent oxidoreductase [Mesorhizobium sp. ES1-6]